jgi:hypothetical protein
MAAQSRKLKSLMIDQNENRILRTKKRIEPVAEGHEISSADVG